MNYLNLDSVSLIVLKVRFHLLWVKYSGTGSSPQVAQAVCNVLRVLGLTSLPENFLIHPSVCEYLPPAGYS